MSLIFSVLSSLVLASPPHEPVGDSVQPMTATGQVLVISRGACNQVYLYENRRLWNLWATSNVLAQCRFGDNVIVNGYRDPIHDIFPDVFATNLVSSSPTAPPRPLPVDRWNDLVEGPVMPAVSISCTIVSAFRDDLDSQWNWIQFRAEDGTGYAAATENEYPLAGLRKLLDSEVNLHGIVFPLAHWRHNLRRVLFLYGENGIETRKEAPTDPFSVPDLSETESAHRRKISGTVMAVGRDRIFLSTGKTARLSVILSSESARPDPGQHVTASGFPGAEVSGLRLNEALVRISAGPGSPLPAATDLTADQLFSDASGHDIANVRYIGKVIRLSGHVGNSAEDIRLSGFVQLRLGTHQVAVDISSVHASLPDDLGPGYKLSAAGLCHLKASESTDRVFAAFSGFSIYPRLPTDIKILARPSWWTPFRLMIIIAALAVILLAVLAWNRTLRTLSERRGRQLAQEELSHARAELKIEERTRLAVELHDSISQTLTGIAFQVEAAMGSFDGQNTPARRFLTTARQMIASCRQELRCCLWDLRSRTFEEKDMTEAVRRTVAPHIGKAECRVRFNVPRERLSESTVHAVLRIVRELVVNAIRHGQARHIRIAGEYSDDTIRFSVCDDGIGFDPDRRAGPVEGHFGLQGVKERAAEAGGSVTLSSMPHHGTKVVVTLHEENNA